MTASSSIAGYRSVVGGGTWAPEPRDRVSVSGPDAATYLQGQLSQDVAAMAVDASAWTLLLDPTGKLGSWLRVTRTAADAFVLDGDPGSAERVVARLNRFMLRTDATIETLPPHPSADSEPGSGSSATVDRVGAPGTLEVDRIEAGVPSLGAEIVDDVIPAELGQWLIDASVSFTKGCYTGQELVARIDSRGGNVPRHLRGLVVDGELVPPPGAEVVVVVASGDGGGETVDKVVGAVTSAARSDRLDAPVALAYVHRTVEPPAAVVVRWEGFEATALVRPLPID